MWQLWNRTNAFQRGSVGRKYGANGTRRRRSQHVDPPAVERLEDRTLLSAGALDPSFGNGGKVVTDFELGNEDVFGANTVAVHGDKIFVAIRQYHPSTGTPRLGVVKYNGDGSLDTSYGTNGLATIDGAFNSNLVGIAVQSDGSVVVAAETWFSDETGVDWVVARLTPGGQLDGSFDGDGLQTIDIGSAYGYPGSYDQLAGVAVLADGSVLLGGHSYNAIFSGGSDFAVARLTPGGQLDTSYDGDGIQTIDFGPYSAGDTAFGMAVRSDGTVVLAGSTQGTGYDYDFAVAQLTPDGQLDTSFNGDGRQIIDFGSDEIAYAVAIQADGTVVVAGATYVSSGTDMALARLTPTGQLDTSFDGDGKQTVDIDFDDSAQGLAVLADGSVIVSGYTGFQFLDEGYYRTQYDFVVARLTPAGQLDPSFDGDGWQNIDFGSTASTYDIGMSVAVQADGKIVIAGFSYQEEFGTFDIALARLLGNDNAPLTVEIDVKPGSDSNPINLASEGVIAVAILTTGDFDASTVDAATVTFAGASAVKSSLEDVDGDGDLDMVLHFRTQDTQLRQIYEDLLIDDHDADGILDSTRQTAVVELTGTTQDDLLFQGFDAVNLFLSGKSLRQLLASLFGA